MPVYHFVILLFNIVPDVNGFIQCLVMKQKRVSLMCCNFVRLGDEGAETG